MKNPQVRRPGSPGYVSYVMVLVTGTLMLFLVLSFHTRAVNSQQVQGKIQLAVDYSEKEEAVLRSILTITPNRAIRAMQHNSNSSGSISNPLRWRNIFNEALTLANARNSISPELLSRLPVANARPGNIGDSALSSADKVFHQIAGVNDNLDTSFASAGINRTLGTGFPVPLSTANATTIARDPVFPIISRDKAYGSLAVVGRDVLLPVGQYHPEFNIIQYPDINFGWAVPRDATDPAGWRRKFVAKRNWWAFAVNMRDHDSAVTRLARPDREFVLSIYEVPSQLPISASAFMALGQYNTGDAWQNVTINGGVFAGRAVVEGSTSLAALASRRGISLSGDAVIGNPDRPLPNNSAPFAPGQREQYLVDLERNMISGEFYPVSLASESGRAAFVPINRGRLFFDRFDPAVRDAESNTVSPTTWNQYSVGALQCAMRLDVTRITSGRPDRFRFSYLGPGVNDRRTFDEPLVTGVLASLPPGYVKVADENQTFNFGTSVVDVAYGANGRFFFQTEVTGPVAFNNARFGDPIVGTFKAGFSRPSAPYKVRNLPSGKTCVAVYPERIPAFLQLIGGATTAVNHSLVVNVDYTTTGTNNTAHQPAVPCRETDFGLIIQECRNLTGFTRGFSLVTNLRTFIGDDFNVVAATPPAGYTPPAGETYFPPVSLFAPEKRYGVDADPFAVSFSGQVGSLASEDAAQPIRPLDSKNRSNQDLAANRIRVNLRPIRHPAELPPVTMMNWLVVLEERRAEFVNN